MAFGCFLFISTIVQVTCSSSLSSSVSDSTAVVCDDFLDQRSCKLRIFPFSCHCIETTGILFFFFHYAIQEVFTFDSVGLWLL